MNILKTLYKYSPMNFYILLNEKTIIKSISRYNQGYSFNRLFSQDEIDKIWSVITLVRRSSVMSLCVSFILLLYFCIFPNYSKVVLTPWYINLFLLVFVLFIIYVFVLSIATVYFKYFLKKQYGKYSIAKFPKTIKNLNSKYYRLYKKELIKLSVLIAIIVFVATFVSPVNIIENLVQKEQYSKVILATNVGVRLMPISSSMYSIRAYAKFRMGDYEGAIKDYDLAYSYSEGDYRILNFDNKIYIKYFLKQYDSALKDYDEQITQINDNNRRNELLWDKAQFLYNIKRYDESVEVYTSLINQADLDKIYILKDRLYLERASVYKALGKSELEKQDYINGGNSDLTTDDVMIPPPNLIYDNHMYN